MASIRCTRKVIYVECTSTMELTIWLTLTTIVLATECAYSLDSSMPGHPAHWLDPDDMFNYDRRHKVMRYEVPTRTTDERDAKNAVDNRAQGMEIAELLREIQLLKTEKLTAQKHYNRLIRLIMECFTKDFNADYYTLMIDESITTGDYEKLEQFLTSQQSKQPPTERIDAILEVIFKKRHLKSFLRNVWSIKDSMWEIARTPLVVIMLVSIGTFFASKFVFENGNAFQIAMTIAMTMFTLGYMWTYYHLVEREEIRQMARMDYYQNEQYKQCKDSSKGFLLPWIYRLFWNSNIKECEKEYEAKFKTAYLTITPPRVLMEMCAVLATGVLRPFVDTFIYFMTSLKDALPWPLNWIVMCFFPPALLLTISFSLAICRTKEFSFNILHLIKFAFNSRDNHTCPPLTDRNRQDSQSITVNHVLDHSTIKKLFLDYRKASNTSEDIRTTSSRSRVTINKKVKKPSSAKNKLALKKKATNQQLSIFHGQQQQPLQQQPSTSNEGFPLENID